jgi:hypothetical protein
MHSIRLFGASAGRCCAIFKQAGLTCYNLIYEEGRLSKYKPDNWQFLLRKFWLSMIRRGKMLNANSKALLRMLSVLMLLCLLGGTIGCVVVTPQPVAEAPQEAAPAPEEAAQLNTAKDTLIIAQ